VIDTNLHIIGFRVISHSILLDFHKMNIEGEKICYSNKSVLNIEALNETNEEKSLS